MTKQPLPAGSFVGSADATTTDAATNAADVTAVIHRDLKITGSVLVANGRSLAVYGEVHGPIESDGLVIIEESAVVYGDVQADRLVVAGQIQSGMQGLGQAGAGAGEVLARSLLTLKGTGEIRAQRIRYGELESERGGRVMGELTPVEVRALSTQQEPVPAAPVVEGLSTSLDIRPDKTASTEIEAIAETSAESRLEAAFPKLKRELQPLVGLPALIRSVVAQRSEESETSDAEADAGTGSWPPAAIQLASGPFTVARNPANVVRDAPPPQLASVELHEDSGPTIEPPDEMVFDASQRTG